jgi:AAA domain
VRESRKDAASRLVGLSHAEVLALEVPPAAQLVEDVVEAGTLGAIAALPERYKSWVALELGFKVASGSGRFLGQAKVTKGGPVGYWWQDDSVANEAGRVKEYAGAHDYSGALPIRWHLNEGLRLPDDISRLRAEVEREAQVLVVLDSLYNFLPGLNLKDEEVALVLAAIKAGVCDPTGCTVCYVDHAPWPSEGNRGQRRGYGSVFKAAAIRWGIFLEKPGSTLYLEASGNNIRGIKRSVAAWDEDELELRLVEVTPKAETAARVRELREA